LVRKSMETKSKMAAVPAILDERRVRMSSNGTFLQSPPMSHREIGSIDPGICPLIDGNQIQDGGRSGHLGWVAELIIERNLPLVTPNTPKKNRINRPRHLSYNWWKPNVYGHQRRPGHNAPDILWSGALLCILFTTKLDKTFQWCENLEIGRHQA
jgi:hypothetical protein